MASRARSKVTQADVARVAGVSQATVSHVLRNDGSDLVHVGAETRRRVLDAITRTGYAADPIAQRMAKGRNQIVGVFTYERVFPRDPRNFYQPFLIGLEEEAERAGCDLLLFTSAPAVSNQRRLFDNGWNRLSITDGSVLLGRHPDRNELARLIERELPFVFIGRRETPAGIPPYVSADYLGATTQTVEMLIEQGHRAIGFLGDLSDDEALRDRVMGYRRAIGEAGLRPVLLDHTELTGADAYRLITDNQLTAVVLGTERLAVEVRTAVISHGGTVPGDLSIAVLGKPDQPSVEGPIWGGFGNPREQIGAAALRMLMDLLAAPSSAEVETVRLISCPCGPGDTVAPPSQSPNR